MVRTSLKAPTPAPVPAGVGSSVRGRRRDPEIDDRALDAALQVYVDRGWAGFTFDVVAKEAGVGKPALYRRWESPAHLLVDAFSQLNLPIPRDCGSLKADLLDLGHQFIEWYKQPERAFFSMRLALDRWEDDHLAELFDKWVRAPRIASAIQLSEMAVARGEISSPVIARTMLELLMGSMQSSFTQTAKKRQEELLRSFPSYVETITEIIVAGVDALSNAERDRLEREPIPAE